MKLVWSKPKMTEVKIELTSGTGGGNKVGTKADGGKMEDGTPLCGDLIPCDCS